MSSHDIQLDQQSPGDDEGSNTSDTLDTVFRDDLLAMFAARGEVPSEERMAEVTEEVLSKFLPEGSKILIDRIMQDAPAWLAESRADRARFQGVIRQEWGKPLDLLEIIIEGFYTYGRDYLLSAMKGTDVERSPTIQAIAQLHARAVRTAREVLYLLEAGLADGAFARWRTLHEITVVALVLDQYGDELSVRYLLHDAVRIDRQIKDLDRHTAALGWEQVNKSDRTAISEEVAALRKRFGPVFATADFGWVDGVIPVRKRQRPNLADLERAVQLEKFRPFFGWASESVHGGPLGLRSLGIPLNADDFLYAGGSTSGLADPGQNTALSLGHFIGILLTKQPTVDWLIHGQALVTMTEHCRDEFIRTNDVVEETTRVNMAQSRRPHGSQST
jgi:hypothetical protein